MKEIFIVIAYFACLAIAVFLCVVHVFIEDKPKLKITVLTISVLFPVWGPVFVFFLNGLLNNEMFLYLGIFIYLFTLTRIVAIDAHFLGKIIALVAYLLYSSVTIFFMGWLSLSWFQ